MRQVRLRDGSTSRRAASSVSSRVAVGAEGVAPRVLGSPGGRRHGVDLEHRVVGTVDLDVEPDVEQVLVVRRGQAGGDHVGVVAGSSPSATAMVDMIPVSFTSSCIVPSR